MLSTKTTMASNLPVETYDHVITTKFRSRVKFIKLQYEWKIDRFGERADSKISSPLITFSTEDEKDAMCYLYLDLYPKKYVGEVYHVTLDVCLLSSTDSRIFAKFKVSIIDVESMEISVINEECLREYTTEKATSFFLKRRDYLLSNKVRLLPNDQLTLNCELIVQKTFTSVENEVQVPECKVLEDFGSLLQNEKYSDVTLTSKGRQFKVHKGILASRSPVFDAMFEHNMKEKENNQVEIDDVEPQVLAEMLNFVYTGQSPNLGTMAQALLAAADKYMLDRLKTMCEAHLCAHLTLDEAPDLVILADRHSANQLKTKVAQFLCVHGTV